MRHLAGFAVAVIALAPSGVFAAPPAPTFTNDVAPILYNSCVGCHRPGEIAPMSLISYDDVRPWAKSIRLKVASREMPPWGADPRFGKFKDDRSLSADELALLFYVTSTAHADDTVRMIGWVSDGHCTVDHMKEGGAACVRKCIAGATHVNPDWKPGGMVLVTEDKKVWKVDNADALWGLESQRVEITATRNDEVGSVKVMKVLSPKK